MRSPDVIVLHLLLLFFMTCHIFFLQMKNKTTTPATDDQIQKKLDLIEQWACMIQRHCGTEQNSDKQLACVKAIAQNAKFLLCKDVLGKNTNGF